MLKFNRVRWTLILIFVGSIATSCAQTQAQNPNTTAPQPAPLTATTSPATTIQPQQDPAKPEGIAEALIIANNPRYGYTMRQSEVDDRLNQWGFARYDLYWEGTGIIPVFFTNSADENGIYECYIFWWDETQRKLFLQAKLSVDLTETKDQTIPLNWTLYQGSNVGDSLQFSLLVDGQVQFVTIKPLRVSNLPAQIKLPDDLDINGTRRAIFLFK